MNEKIIIGISEIKFLQEGETNFSDCRKQITLEDLQELYEFVKTIPEPIKKSREELEKLATAMTALSFGKQKVVINEIHFVNPSERDYKNKRKW